jgi:hypothetical protein
MDIDFDSMDEEVAAQVRAALEAKEGELAKAQGAAARKGLIYGAEAQASYPRAIHALRSGTVAEPELSGDELTAWLAAKESEYTSLGVTDPTAPAPAPTEEAAAPNPAEGWGSAPAAGTPPSENLAGELQAALAQSGELTADTIMKIDQLNRSNQGRKDLRSVTAELSDKRPITF